MTPAEIAARKKYVELAGPTIGRSAPTASPTPTPTARQAPARNQATQPQASAAWQYNLGWPSIKPAGGKSNRGLASYSKPLILDRRALQNNNRVTVHDSPGARLILRRQVETTIGAGIKVSFTPSAKILGLTDEQAEEWGEDASARFHLWAKSKDSDATGRNTFYQNQGLWGWSRWRDGESFPRFNYNTKDKELVNPLQLSFVDPNQIAGDEFITNYGSITDDTGIITDENGKETGYKVWIQDKKGKPKMVEVPARDKKTGLPVMAHSYNPEFSWQGRGIPEMAHAIQWFERIEDFDINTATKMSNSAALNFTVENALNDPSDAGFASLDSGGAAGVTPPVTDTTAQTGLPAFGPEQVTACNLPESTLTEPGVNMLGSRQGDKIKLIDSASPAEGSNEYMETKFNILSATGGMAPEMVKMLFTNSHAASRASMGLQAAVIKIRIADLDADLINDVVFSWMFFEIAAGRIQAPGFSDPVLREAWLSHVLRIAPLPDVDPEKTRKAVKLALDEGLTDYDTEAMNYNGSDGKQNRRKLVRQIKELPAPPAQAATPAAETGEGDGEGEDDRAAEGKATLFGLSVFPHRKKG